MEEKFLRQAKKMKIMFMFQVFPALWKKRNEIWGAYIGRALNFSNSQSLYGESSEFFQFPVPLYWKKGAYDDTHLRAKSHGPYIKRILIFIFPRYFFIFPSYFFIYPSYFLIFSSYFFHIFSYFLLIPSCFFILFPYFFISLHILGT
mgnify:CR=1 FL=1